MQKHINAKTAEVNQKQDLQSNMQRRLKNEKSDVLTRDYNPFENITCKIGDNACAAKHVSLIQRARVFQPINKSQRIQTLLRLQQQYGNQFVQRIIVQHVSQAKLTIGQPVDIYEQEADRVAERVMQMPEPQMQPQAIEEEEELQTKPLAGQITPLVQKQVEEEEEEVQPKELPGQIAEVTPNPKARISVIRGGGQPLPVSTRAFFEPRFGYDFSQVQVHMDNQAAQSAKTLNARAFTVGRDVVFGVGQYAPNTTGGKWLLAHELTHVVQQNLDNKYSSSTLNKTLRQKTRISLTNGKWIARWEISGDTATVNNRSDRLWNLARDITGHGRDWPCIWPEEMKSPRAWDDNYERYIQIGDKFDISNLNLTTGPSATFTFQGADNALQALQVLYGGTDPINLGQEIADLANDGETPIQNLTICGHTGGNRIWGDNADFSPAGLNSETPAPTGAGAHNKMGPRRCWFTRNANVRFVGCSSQTIARQFTNVFLRRGASALGTNHWLCGWHQTSPVEARFMSVEGPPCTWPPTATRLTTAAAVNSAPGLWVTINGRL